MTTEVAIGPVRVGGGHPLALIAGPGVIESRTPLLQLGERLARTAGSRGRG
jgi:2-dehydro-3-deoxyphosphooctonate aldolase (KDO 8-P synthase)